MPDESCRSCGGELATYSLCSECRKVTQKVCKSCNAFTRKQFHNKCINSEQLSDLQRKQVLQLVQRAAILRKPTLSGRSLAMIFGVIGFLALAFTAASYLSMLYNVNLIPNNDSSQNLPHSEVTKPSISMNNIQHAQSTPSYENCLAYGSGESLTVTCPTQYGYVYKAILDLPRDLADKFSDTVFSIRGASLTENLDGSVTLQYQNTYYKTGFFAS